MITSPLYWHGLRDKVWLELALHGGKDKRLSDKYFYNRRARPFPHLYLSESPTRKAMAQSDWWDISSNAHKMFSNLQMFLTNPEFLSTHNAAGAIGVQVKLLISVKSDSWMHCFR